MLVPSAASWDRVGEAAEGESTRVVRTQPESRRRFVALLIGGMMDANRHFLLLASSGLLYLPQELRTSPGRGGMVRGQ